MKLKDRRGQRFGRLTVVRFAGIVRRRRSQWACRCECGNEVVITSDALIGGHTQSCGCLQVELVRKRLTVHGDRTRGGRAGRGRAKLYNTWKSMRRRCRNENDQDFAYYGARGIKVCDEWQSYPAFRDWALANGYRDNLSIDRVDFDGDYEPGNCRWATPVQQARNTRRNVFVTHDGQTLTIAGWAERTGICAQTLRSRLKVYGWPPARAFTTPVRTRGA